MNALSPYQQQLDPPAIAGGTTAAARLSAVCFMFCSVSVVR